MYKFEKKQLQSKVNQISYDLLPNNCLKQQKTCWTIAIDHNNKFLVAGAELNFNLFQFKEGAIKKIQIIQSDKSWITTLNFQRKMSFIISGSNSIKIWSNFLQSNPKYLFQLNEHSLKIQCLIVSELDQPLIISGSQDNTIKFWYKQDLLWSCQQTIKDHSNTVTGLSLNKEANTLISCGEDNQILIIKNIHTYKWKVFQKIQSKGVRLSFISKDTFAFQPWQSSSLELYQYDPITGLYLKIKEFPIQGCKQFCTYLFPCIFVSSKLMILSKNGYSLNLVQLQKINSKYEGKLEQSIDFNFPNNWQGNIFGTMSENGEFLITRDSKSKQIQIRQYILNDQQRKIKKPKFNCQIF